MEVNREALEMQAQLAQTKAMEAQEKGEIAIKELRKHIAWYTKNLKNSSDFRSLINTIESKDALIKKLDEYFNTL